MLNDDHRWVLEDFPTLVFYCGPDDPGVEWVNRTWLDFRGRTLEEEVGYGFLDGVHPDDRDRVVDHYLDHYHRREPYRVEYRLRRYDGAYRWLDELGRPLFAPDGTFAGFFGSCSDVTDRHEALEQLESADAMSSLLLQTIFHDLTGPLSSATAASNLLRSALEDVGPDVGRLLDLLDHQHERMTSLLRAMRHLDQAEQGHEDGRSELTSLEALVRTATDGLDLDGHDLRHVLDDVEVVVDPVLVGRALDNVLRNAIQHTPAGSTVVVRAEVVDGAPRIVVDDDGPGLPEDPAPLFQPYGRSASDGGGTGLGLSIAGRYVDALDGRLEAEASPDGGARFVISLPAATLRRR
jgi:PAS domain S-box-containing protein